MSAQRKSKGKTVIEYILLAVLFIFLYAALLVGCENKIIYHPNKYPEGFWEPESLGVHVEDVSIKASDGTKLHGWYIPGESPVATMLWFHGNAGNITHRLHNIVLLRPLKLNIFIFDYRGYGKSEGSPDEPGLYLDSQAAYDYLIKEKKTAPEKIFLFGRSLGCVFAVEVAVNNPAAGLILESCFTSAKEMAGKVFPILPIGWALKSKLDPVNKVPELKIPKLFFHGTKDEVVPYKLGRKLFEVSAEPKEFHDIERAGHNNTVDIGGKKYFDTLNQFLTANLKNHGTK